MGDVPEQQQGLQAVATAIEQSPPRFTRSLGIQRPQP